MQGPDLSDGYELATPTEPTGNLIYRNGSAGPRCSDVEKNTVQEPPEIGLAHGTGTNEGVRVLAGARMMYCPSSGDPRSGREASSMSVISIEARRVRIPFCRIRLTR